MSGVGTTESTAALITVVLAIGVFARTAVLSARSRQADPDTGTGPDRPVVAARAWARQRLATLRRPALAPPLRDGDPACGSVPNPGVFFPDDENGPAAAEAKAVCARCALRSWCLSYALTTGMPAGIWGGLSTTERQADPGT